MTVTALIVDDEPVARRRVRRLLAERHAVSVVGECSGGLDAVQSIRTKRPDLVFLDVQMPDIDGFEVLRRLGDDDDLPTVIFVTAYDQYALQAFDANAVDYLLKPYSPHRFWQAVDRALRWVGSDRGEEQRRLRTVVEELLQERAQREKAGAGASDRFLVQRGGVTQFIRVSDVDWLEAEGNYVRLHVGATSHLVRSTLSSCEERLAPRQFARTHRRHIVNLERVRELQPWFGGDYIVVLRDGRKVPLSRSYRDAFRRRMLGT